LAVIIPVTIAVGPPAGLYPHLSAANMSGSIDCLAEYEFLQNLTNVSYLFISEIRTTDFSALANMTKLERLYISDNIIDNVEFLRHLERLEMLELVSDVIDKTNYVEIINEHREGAVK